MKENKRVSDEKHWQDAFVDDDHHSFISKTEAYGHRYLKVLEQIFPTPLESSERCFNRAMKALDRMK